MVLENKNYVPTLAIRASEMNGLEFLPGATKDRLMPCVLLAPWANSNTLEKAIERLQRAFLKRPYFLDIDRDYELTKEDSGPQQELIALKDPSNSYRNWTNFATSHGWIWPCVQTMDQSGDEVGVQIGRFQEAGRPYCLRIERGRVPTNIDGIAAAFSASGTADFAVILEGGWTNDPLSLAVWFDGLIGGSLQSIDATVPIILSCTSMPKLFSTFDGGISSVPFSNRQLVDQVSQRRSNRSRIIYGDWGSTRPRESGVFAFRPYDRVDYPTEAVWYIARNKKDGWGFRRAAQTIIASPDWVGGLGIWGEEMIQNTSVNEELGIDTPQKNVAARVNIHLHRQAFFGQSSLDQMNFDEDWQDT